MNRLFGTDGVRGVAGSELTCDLAMNLGRAVAFVLTRHSKKKPNILIGRDTRISGQMLESALVAGICSAGACCSLVGVVPTPAVSFLVTRYECDAGVMISASHNLMEFNGIKIFNENGFKLSDELEDEIESYIFKFKDRIPYFSKTGIGTYSFCKNAVEDYVEHIVSTVDGNLSGIKVAVDCANGSAVATAERLFKKLKIDADFFNVNPNGCNINEDCGSTHIEKFAKYVKNSSYDVGVAFDGDADRCLAVDGCGTIIDGDQLIAIFARHMKDSGCLANNTVVVTVMSNLGFFHFAEKNNINLEVTKVGDRYVLKNMIENGYTIGGEQSGHIIFKDYANTGDGQLTAIKLIQCIKESRTSFSELAKVMCKVPQVMVNIGVNKKQKEKYFSSDEIETYIQNKEKILGKDSRILVRCSGTEPIIRVMIEGPDEVLIKKTSVELAKMISEIVGA